MFSLSIAAAGDRPVFQVPVDPPELPQLPGERPEGERNGVASKKWCRFSFLGGEKMVSLQFSWVEVAGKKGCGKNGKKWCRFSFRGWKWRGRMLSIQFSGKNGVASAFAAERVG
jgi:hypothetical protein